MWKIAGMPHPLGIDFLSPVKVIDDGSFEGWKWVYFKEPDGITLELVEYYRPA